MKIQEYIATLERRIAELQKGFGQCVASTHSKMANRIFIEGQNSKGDEIGGYSTKEIWMDAQESPMGLPMKGKPNKQGQRRNTIRTSYFSGGYKEFRAAVGRRSSHVDLRLGGVLMRDFVSSLSKEGEKWVAGTKNELNSKKIEGNEDRFGTIFKLTEAERANFAECVKQQRIKNKI